jgi:hypothetical protein
MEEPSDAVLSQLMKEAAEEATRLTRRLINQPTRWAILFGKQIQNKRGTRVIVSLSSTLRKFMLLRGYFSI